MRVHTQTILRLTDDPHEYLPISDESYEHSGRIDHADRSIANQANANSKTAGAAAGQYGSAATGVAGQIVPELERQAANPIGYTPTQTNAQLVAGEQGAGGSNSSIAGTAGLAAGRTRNSSALSGVLDAAARAKAQQLSTNALNVQNRSADLGIQRQDQARGALTGIYGTDVGASLKGMGIQDQDLSTELQAKNQGWAQNLNMGLNTIGTLGKDAASAYKDTE